MAKPSEHVSWEQEFDRWVEPLLAALGGKPRRKWAPVYMKGLLGEGARKSVEPMAARVAPGEVQQLHHFVSASPWEPGAVWGELARKAQALPGGPTASLIVDDTALVKQGRHSVGVGHQYCGQLGKKANCQSVVTLTLARGEVPLCVGMRLYLPQAWAEDKGRRERAKVPEGIEFKTKWEIALSEIDGLMESGLGFGEVLADAGYGECAAFRRGLAERGLVFGVGIPSTLIVYPAQAKVRMPKAKAMGRPRRHGEPSHAGRSAEAMIQALGKKAWRKLAWREGSKGPLRAEFARVRVRVGDGERAARGRGLPGMEAWLLCERRSSGELRYHLSNLPESASLKAVASQVKRRWACEQAHQQMKEELGLDHFEGRSWGGLHRHLAMVAASMAFLQHLRLKEAGGPGREPKRREPAGPQRPKKGRRRGKKIVARAAS